MTISNLLIVSIPVSDPDRAIEFYRDTLGFELVADRPMGPGARWVQLQPPGAATSVTLVTWFDTMAPGSLHGLVLETDDIDHDVTRLEADGVTFDGGISDMPWGRSAVFRDPDGNELVLQTNPATQR